jgi:nucleotide-binding universal stress UspA family protein
MAQAQHRHSVTDVSSSPSVGSGPVIVGIDGDDSARDAFALGHRLAELLDTSVDIVTVRSAAPDDALRDAARFDEAALIVLGPTHRRSLARTLRGTARRLLSEAPCPIAIAPAGFAARPETPILDVGVGFEPTPEGVEALAVAHGLAARVGGTLRAIGVALPLSRLAVDDVRDRAPYLENERRIVDARLESALAELPGEVPATADARVGDPAVELASASRDLDLLVCGSRGRGPLRAVLLGSVTEQLLRGAGCPVVIVPRPAGQPRRPRRTMPSMVLPPPRG